MNRLKKVHEATGRYPADEEIESYHPVDMAPPYLQIDHTQAIRDLVLPACKSVHDSSGGTMVGSKYIKTKILVDEEPLYWGRSKTPFQTYNSEKCLTKFIATGCQLSIRFIDQCLLMQVPYKDWLRKHPELMVRLEESRNFEKITGVDDSTAVFTVYLWNGTILNTSESVVVNKA